MSSRLAPLLDSAAALALSTSADPRTADLRRTLATLQANVVAHSAPPLEMLRRALQSAALLAADGAISAELVAVLGEAYGEALPGGTRLLAKIGAPPAPTRLVALRVPSARWIARAPFSREDAEALVLDAEPEASPDPPPEREAEPAGPIPALRSSKGGDPRPVRFFYAGVASHCLDTIARCARQRVQQPLDGVAGTERTLLVACDALAAIGDDVVSLVLETWEGTLDSPSPWQSWAAAAALSSLAGVDALEAVAFGLAKLPFTEALHAAAVAEALAIFNHPELDLFARDLVDHRHPLLRAAGIETLSLRGALTADEVRRLLWDANVPVLLSAVRALGRLPDEEGASLLPILLRWMKFPDPRVAWSAARVLLQHGRTEPLDELREGRLRNLAPADALELLVLAGDASDLERMQRLITRIPVGQHELSAIARFGHVGAWTFLLHHLAEGELVDEATSALVTLFGPLTSPEQLDDAAAWKRAILSRGLDTNVRYRRGEPWSPRVVAAEIELGSLSREDVEARFNELQVRAGLAPVAELWRFSAESEPMRKGALAAARKLPAPPGGWAR
jgi:hypothetical protein